MPRPTKCRKVCSLPQINHFVPVNDNLSTQEAVVLTVDEYETIRLIDYEGFMQEDCVQYMNIARTTVQQIYTEARKKLSQVLVEGRPLKIEGGSYLVCDGFGDGCSCGKNCRRHCLQQEKSIIKGKPENE